MKIIIGTYTKCIDYCDELFGGNYFSFALAYVHPEMPFRELWRFLWESRHQTRFKNTYTGNVVIDITAWAERSVNDYFLAFLYYLKDNENSLSCVIISEVEPGNDICECIEKLYTVERIYPDGEVGKDRNKRMIGFSSQEGIRR